jgi:hypothetical protein
VAVVGMTTLGQLAATLHDGITVWAGIVIIVVVTIRTLPDLIRAIRRQPSDDD